MAWSGEGLVEKAAGVGVEVGTGCRCRGRGWWRQLGGAEGLQVWGWGQVGPQIWQWEGAAR